MLTPAPADPERALSLAYAPRRARSTLSALWLLDEQLGAIVARTENPALGQLRLAWWHDALHSLRTTRPADPVLLALADAPEIAPDALLPLIDAWELLLDPLPLADETLLRFADARGSTLFRAAARLLGAEGHAVDEAGRLWALTDLAFRIRDRATAERALALAPRSVGRPPRALAILAALARHDARRGLDKPRRQGAPGRVARAFLAGVTGL